MSRWPRSRSIPDPIRLKTLILYASLLPTEIRDSEKSKRVYSEPLLWLGAGSPPAKDGTKAIE
jgi:hypothetical protein